MAATTGPDGLLDFPFLDLPKEVRDIIYDDLISDHQIATTQLNPAVKVSVPEVMRDILSLQSVCKSLREEVMDKFRLFRDMKSSIHVIFSHEQTPYDTQHTPNLDFFTSYRNFQLDLSMRLDPEDLLLLSNFESALSVIRTAPVLTRVGLQIWVITGISTKDGVEERKVTMEVVKCRMMMTREKRGSGISKAQFEIEFGFRVAEMLRKWILSK